MKEYNILLVEDDEVDIMNVQRSFTKINLSNPIFVARNGVEALQMLNDKTVPRPNVTLLDLNMPKMGGIEFLQNIRSNPDLKSLVVIVLTTSGEEKDVVASYNLNVAGYIVKPVKLEDFVVSMASLGNYWQLSELPKK